MNKKTYEASKADVILLNALDVIRTSNGDGGIDLPDQEF